MRLHSQTRQLLAGAYALGTLSGRARRRFQRMLERDIELRHAWQAWEERLAHLAPDMPAVRPPDSAWSRIEQQLEQVPARTKSPRWNLLIVIFAAVALLVLWLKVRR